MLSNLLQLYLRPEVPVIILGMWVHIFYKPLDPDLEESFGLKLVVAVFMIPLSIVLIGAFYMAATYLSWGLAFIAVVLGFPYSYEVIEGVLMSQLAGPVSDWAAAFFPWVVLIFRLLKIVGGEE